ncbi:MAG: AEC family transporter [Velocimicrobium sp.]
MVNIMTHMSELLSLQGQMFLLIIVGIVLKNKNILPQNGKIVLSDLLLYFILPCNIINSFRMEFSNDTYGKFGMLLICAILIQVVAYILSRVLYNKEPERIKKVLQYVTIVSNSGFLGLPIVEEIFGTKGLMYASIFIVPMRVMMWTAGIACFTGSADKKAAIKKVIVHPCIIAVYLGLVLLFTQIDLPPVLDKTIRGVGGCTTTISMIVIGLILAEVDFRYLINVEILKIIVVRLIVLPIFALVIAKILGLSEMLTGVVVILTAMPAGSTSAMLAAKYDGDYKFASKCVVSTTIISLLSLSVWYMII